MTVLRSCMSISETQHTSIVRDSRVLTKEASWLVWYRMLTSMVPKCSFEWGFSELEALFRTLESLATVTPEDEVKRGSWPLKVDVGGITTIEERHWLWMELSWVPWEVWVQIWLPGCPQRIRVLLEIPGKEVVLQEILVTWERDLNDQRTTALRRSDLLSFNNQNLF